MGGQFPGLDARAGASFVRRLDDGLPRGICLVKRTRGAIGGRERALYRNVSPQREPDAESKTLAKTRRTKRRNSPCACPVVCYHRLMIRTLTAQQAHDLMTRDDVEVIDVREPHE